MPNHIEISPRAKNIVLIGFMGAGKTTVGQMLANKLYRDFIDIDLEIEKQFGMPIPEIFAKFGEKKFREAEKSVIEHFCTQTQLKIISLGGGAFMQDEIRKICLATSVVLFLDLSFDSWKDRLELIIDSRPVLKGKSLQEMEELFIKRQDFYAYNNSKINTSNLNPEDTVDYILHSLKLGWEIYDPHFKQL